MLWKKFKLKLDEYRKLPKMAKRDDLGNEALDPVPIAPPIGWFKQPSMFDQVRDMVRSEHMRLYAEAQGAETFEEASDFEVEDEIFPTSQFEDADDFEPLAKLAERRQKKFREEYLAKREKRILEREERELALEEAERAAVRPPEPRPSPKPGAGPGAGKAPGERSESLTA